MDDHSDVGTCILTMKLETIVTKKVTTTGESKAKVRLEDSDGVRIGGGGSDMQSIVMLKSSMTFIAMEPGEGFGEFHGGIIRWILLLRHDGIDWNDCLNSCNCSHKRERLMQ
jgi:hypothetical protein